MLKIEGWPCYPIQGLNTNTCYEQGWAERRLFYRSVNSECEQIHVTKSVPVSDWLSRIQQPRIVTKPIKVQRFLSSINIIMRAQALGIEWTIGNYAEDIMKVISNYQNSQSQKTHKKCQSIWIWIWLFSLYIDCFIHDVLFTLFKHTALQPVVGTWEYFLMSL